MGEDLCDRLPAGGYGQKVVWDWGWRGTYPVQVRQCELSSVQVAEEWDPFPIHRGGCYQTGIVILLHRKNKKCAFFARFLFVYARNSFIYKALRVFVCGKIPLSNGVIFGNMGGAILQKWHFWCAFLVVWGAQSRVFDPTFDPNLTLIGFFEGVLAVFRSVRITQKNASVLGRLRGVSMVLKGRFSYNYTASFRWCQQNVPVRLILRACTHNACRCGALYYRSKQRRSTGRF